MGVVLTDGAIKRICSDRFCFHDDDDDEEFKPVLQIIDSDLITVGVCLSDGTHFNPAVLNRNLVRSGKLKIGSIVKLNNFSVDEPMELDSKRIMIAEVDVIVKECDQIGEPIPLPNSASSSDVDLTQGAMATMFSDDFSGDEEHFEPVLQVVDLTTTNFFHLSDGTHYDRGILEGDYLLDMYNMHIGSVVKLTN